MDTLNFIIKKCVKSGIYAIWIRDGNTFYHFNNGIQLECQDTNKYHYYPKVSPHWWWITAKSYDPLEECDTVIYKKYARKHLNLRNRLALRHAEQKYFNKIVK